MWFNPIIYWLLRSPLHGLVSKNIMLMTYTGRKSGKFYTTPMNYLMIQNGNHQVLYTTSYRERVWWRNLRGGAPVTIRLQGKDRDAVAEVIEDERQCARELNSYLTKAPQLARYYRVGLDKNRQPIVADINQAAEKMVVVKTHLS